ncbi:MAG: DAK2 domain-containing protein [Clostridia bacterium]|nr:DAK2 domain-containing protein [Clostridia bacterium]
MLAQMMISGANNLYNKKQIVDELNVFPVPDGDTGTNMSMTVTAMSKSLQGMVTQSVTKVADAMSYATLRGARGNSGVILSQFFRGISKSLKGVGECDVKQFSNALLAGSQAAYNAVMKPTEGTILTVAREIAQRAVKISEESEDFENVLEVALKKGNKTLAKTTEMLPALKKAGVVDAGGQGWIFFLEGALEYLRSGNVIESVQTGTAVTKENKSAQEAIDTNNIKYKYCTEFIVEKNNPNADIQRFRSAIGEKGDCMLVIDDEEIVKVHIHTNNPGYVLERAIMLGDMINIKIDNMKHQHQNIITANDTEKKEEEEEIEETGEKKTFGFVGICVGDGIADIFRNLGIDRIIEGGQTMNPSTDDIINAVKRVNADTIFVFPNNKNIIMAANQAKEISDKNIVVIPTKSIPQCVSAMLAFSESKDAQQNEAAMNRAIGSIKTGQVTYAVRDTKIDDMVINEGDILGIEESSISVTGNDATQVLKELVEKMTDDDSEFITVYYGEDISRECAEKLEEELEEKYEDFEISVKYGGQSLYYYIISVE